jgi:hypothetical protein
MVLVAVRPSDGQQFVWMGCNPCISELVNFCSYFEIPFDEQELDLNVKTMQEHADEGFSKSRGKAPTPEESAQALIKHLKDKGLI